MYSGLATLAFCDLDDTLVYQNLAAKVCFCYFRERDWNWSAPKVLHMLLQVLLATCFDASALGRLKSLAGEYVTLSTDPNGAITASVDSSGNQLFMMPLSIFGEVALSKQHLLQDSGPADVLHITSACDMQLHLQNLVPALP